MKMAVLQSKATSSYSRNRLPAGWSKSHFLHVLVLLLGLSDGASVPVLRHNTELSQDLESLASSKILMDRTSSSSSSSIENLVKVIRSTSSPRGPGSNKKLSVDAGSEIAGLPIAHFNLNNGKNSPEIMSLLHVAQCRATCLEKFTDDVAPTTTTQSSPEAKEDLDFESSAILKTRNKEEHVWSGEGLTDEINILPKILRLRRKRSLESRTDDNRSNAFTKKNNAEWDCLRDSNDCLMCWKSCQILESEKSKPEASAPLPSSTSPRSLDAISAHKVKGKANDVMDLIPNTKQNFLDKQFKRLSNRKQEKRDRDSYQGLYPLSTCTAVDCLVGCQVACSFYQKLLSNILKNENNRVIQTKDYSGVIKITPGKISWSLGKNDDAPLNVVYVVIQEYPNSKWREIAQTVQKEIEIPLELTSTSRKNAKLNSILVLVIGSDGLLSVLSDSGASSGSSTSSIEQHAKFLYNNSGKVVVVESGSLKQQNSQIDNQKNSSESDFRINRDSTVLNRIDDNRAVLTNAETVKLPASVPEDLFDVKLVSLIHQKSLVIAELQWNEIGGNPSQEYLITWELNGGGLKGHLVTDSTSVTLSLWPDTKYQIQVEEFIQNFDSDGEQPVESSPTSLKSVPLTVDTSEASFPSGKSLPLSPESEEEDYIDEHDKITQPSPMKLCSLTSILLISISATIIVVVIFVATAVFWTRCKTTGWPGNFCCVTCRKEPYLLPFDDSTQSEIYAATTTSSSYNPFRFILGQKKAMKSCKQRNYKIFRQSCASKPSEKTAGLESEAPVAVISSSIPASSSLSHCYTDNVWINKSVLSKPTFSSSIATTSCVEKAVSSKSLSSSSSLSKMETTAPAVAAGAIKASEQHCSSSSYVLPSNKSSRSAKFPHLPVTTSLASKIQQVQQRQ